MPNFDATWWPIDDTLVWIASSDRSSLFKHDSWELPEFDDYAYFCGLSELVSALLNDSLQAHASVDTAPIAPVNASYWESVSFLAHWNDPIWRPTWPRILMISHDPFRPEALLDHGERSNIKVPDARDATGAFGYYRLTTSAILRREVILKLWPAQIGVPLTSAERKTRKKGELTIKVEKSLPMMTYNGLSLGQDKHGLSDAKIAEMLQNRWFDEGDLKEREFEAIKKQVWRYYNRLRTFAGD